MTGLEKGKALFEKQEFEKAIEALMNGGSVNFEEKIIIDINNNCQKAIALESFVNSSPLTKLITTLFAGNNDIDYIIKGDNLNKASNINNRISAVTMKVVLYDRNKHSCFIQTTLDNDYLATATDLSIARTIAHESIHAALVYMLLEGMFIMSSGDIQSDYIDLMNGFLNYLETNQILEYSGAQHEIMIELIDSIATLLSNFGKNRGYKLPLNYYKDLAWGGLTHSRDSNDNVQINPIFIEAVPNSSDRERIINTLVAEALNTTQGNLNPKGQPCE